MRNYFCWLDKGRLWGGLLVSFWPQWGNGTLLLLLNIIVWSRLLLLLIEWRSRGDFWLAQDPVRLLHLLCRWKISRVNHWGGLGISIGCDRNVSFNWLLLIVLLLVWRKHHGYWLGGLLMMVHCATNFLRLKLLRFWHAIIWLLLLGNSERRSTFIILSLK